MTKQQKIQEAYELNGFNWLFAKDYVDENGWSKHCVGNSKKLTNKSSGVSWRPKELKGIDNNNGWIRIESKKDLPMKTECYHVFSKEEEYLIGTFQTENIGMIEYWLQNFTHYRPIQNPNKPIY